MHMATIQLSTTSQRIDFSHFYTENFERGYHFACTYTDTETAYDIVSEVFMKMYERKEDLDYQRNVGSLLMTMIRNKCFDHLRHEVYKRTYATSKTYEDSASTADMTASRVEVRELSNIIGNSLATMSAKERDIFISIQMGNKTYKEVAERLQVSKRSVEYCLNKARRTVSDHLHKVYGKAL